MNPIKKLPKPPIWMLNTQIKVIAEVDSEDGVTDEVVFSGKAYYEEGVRRVVNENKQIVELSGVVIVYENIEFKRAYVEIYGTKRAIYRTSRPRNPDGSIYSTEMELM